MKLSRLTAFTLGVIVTAVSVSAVSYVNALNDKPIKACADRKTGAMRYIDKGRCKRTERTLTWNQIGLTGAAGPEGIAGTTGVAGPQGPAGTPGASGGLSSPTGFTPRSVCGANGTTLCAVGVQGPGGGVIVYVDTTNEMPGYDYLEVAPTDASTGVVWSTTIEYCGTNGDSNCQISFVYSPGNFFDSSALGTGRAATSRIVARHMGVAKTDYAAGVADAYTTATASDWFLPSFDELNEVCKYARNSGQAAGADTQCSGGTLRSGFASAVYWSSSEGFGTGGIPAGAAIYNLGEGFGDADNKWSMYRVRPVRAF